MLITTIFYMFNGPDGRNFTEDVQVSNADGRAIFVPRVDDTVFFNFETYYVLSVAWNMDTGCVEVLLDHGNNEEEEGKGD